MKLNEINDRQIAIAAHYDTLSNKFVATLLSEQLLDRNKAALIRSDCH